MPRANRGTRLADKPNASGHWVIAWTDNGRSQRVSTGTASRKEAETILAGFILEREREADAERDRRARSLTIAEVLDLYENNHIAPAVGGVVDQRRALDAGRPVRKFFGAMFPDEIDREVVNRYAADRAAGRVAFWKDGVAPQKAGAATIRRDLQHLVAALNFAAAEKKISAGDVPKIALPAKAEPRSYTLEDDEVARLLATNPDAPVRNRPGLRRLTRAHRFVALMLMAPGRPEAVRGLTWFRVDFEKGTIDYREPGRQQTKKKRVPVPIGPSLMPILRRAWDERTGEYVLDHPGSIKTAFRTLAEAAGLPECTPYTLRHTYGTKAISAGVPPALVAEVMGDTLETVMRNYKHLMTDHLRDAVDVWSAALKAKAI